MVSILFSIKVQADSIFLDIPVKEVINREIIAITHPSRAFQFFKVDCEKMLIEVERKGDNQKAVFNISDELECSYVNNLITLSSGGHNEESGEKVKATIYFHLVDKELIHIDKFTGSN
jgi:hypothetical protein